ncbi:PQQ-binding-like beta-propeller repeat protein [Streptomyces albus]|uniref:outer membrane protein assembly factor BamB family protein n=1 Tax=Streptomyces albus TaxID=1888 RepID=UPI00131DE8E9|nr:PQQ-binding-like beta-propeller repeat protein [Streptomyces albus]
MLAAVLVTLLAGGGAWLLYGDGDSGEDGEALPPHRQNAALAWEQPVPRVPLVEETPTTWFTEKFVVKVPVTEVAGFRRDTGKRAWRVPLRGVTCGTSVEAAAGRAAVRHGLSCELLTVIDLARGEALWTRKLPVPAGTEPDTVDPGRLAVTEEAVAVVLEESATVFRIADQKVLQRLDRLDGSCGVKSVRGGAVLVARAACDGRQVVWVHDPVTGEREWAWPVPAGLQVEGFPSASPLVVTLHRDITEGTHSVYHLPGKGKPAVPIDMGRNVDREAGLCEHVTPRCPGAVAGERTLYLQGPKHASPGDSSAQENEVVAFDLRTGKAMWAAKPEAKRELVPVAELQGDLIAYEPATPEKGGALLRYDGGTGRRSVYERHPSLTSEREREVARNAAPLLDRGMFFLSAEDVYPWEEGEPEPALVAAFR